MAFQSNIGGMPVIDDKNFGLYVQEADVDPTKGRGLIPRDFTLEPYASHPFAGPLKLPLVDPATYDERIEEGEKTQSTLWHLSKLKGVKVKNQQSTNYCWINAPTFCVELMRVSQGLEYVSLSPASSGAKITNFRNVGGWGTKGVDWLCRNGAVPSASWPDNAIDKRYDTPANDALRARYKVTEWVDMKPRNMAEVYTCLLYNIPVAIGLNWWGHEITGIAMVKLAGSKNYGIKIANSWGTGWGENGYGVLSGSKQVPDDAIAPSVVTGGNPNLRVFPTVAV